MNQALQSTRPSATELPERMTEPDFRILPENSIVNSPSARPTRGVFEIMRRAG